MPILRRIGDFVFGQRLVDPTFGKLVFDRSEFVVPRGQPRSRAYFRYWMGRVHFEPTRSEVGVCLPGDETGPTEDQRLLFRELASRWSSLIDPLADACGSVYREWFQGAAALQTSDHRTLFRSLELAGFLIEHPTLYPDRKQFQDFKAEFLVTAETGGHALVAHIKDWVVVRASFE